MSENLIYILSVLSVIAFSSFSFYAGEDKNGARFALGVILFSAVLAPVFSLSGSIRNAAFESSTAVDFSEITANTAEEAYCRGAALAIAEKFSLNGSDVAVFCSDFSLEDMSAEHMSVTLFGRAVYADGRSIREYAEKTFDCEVSVGFG